jgi:predicted component of type VI protein secretion system
MTRSSLYRAALVLAVAGAPFAAFAAPPAPAAANVAPVAQAPEATPPLPQAMEQKIDAHINMLHKQLAITPAQETQWNQFAQVMHDNAAAMHAALDKRGTQLNDMNAADNMQSYAELARVHADNMQKLATSFQTLYASLSDEQKHTADTVFRHQEARHEARHKTG